MQMTGENMQTVEQTLQNTTNDVQKATAKRDTRFNAENAREMAARSVEARRKADEERLANPLPDPLEADYAVRLLARVRTMLDENDEMLMKARDPLDRDRLARASSVLAERERVLAGRPLPGQRRPGPAGRTSAAPVDPL